MRTKMKFLIITVALVISAGVFQKQASAQYENVSYQVFYDQLSPYGQWLDYPNYGNVWIPDAGPNFSPYSTNGYWVHTRYGWTWMSDYSWGWGPFHYGRWDYDSFYGWLWIPDYEWGPSWVNWRHSGGYYGWQPMRPRYGIYSGIYSDQYGYNDHWIFVRNNDFGRHDIYNYYVNRSDYMRIMKNSSVIDNTSYDRRRKISYNSGPNKSEVERNTGTRIRSVNVRDNDMPGQELKNNQLRLYRPQFREPVEGELLRRPVRGDIPQNRQLPVDGNRTIQQQRESVPEYARPERQNIPENQQIKRGETERVQPTTPPRIPAETPRRQSQPVRETQQINKSENVKVQTAPPARVPLETPRRTRQPAPVTPVKERKSERR
ncbi:DUF6600 domain-containing protein [Mariniphaga sp.]|uniref:DUF6600 domain-containing protein n=1 Tax=Mariniphaga sp. TaxID=1954475 RepID=UPI003564B185